MKDNEIQINTLFEYVETGVVRGKIFGKLNKVNDLVNVEKLVACGMFDMYQEALNGV